jgi:hypothetical protein
MANRGRPRKFDVKTIGQMKKVIKQMGLLRAVEALKVDGIEVSISTLCRYARSGRGGFPVKLKRGRRPLEV